MNREENELQMSQEKHVAKPNNKSIDKTVNTAGKQ